MARFWRIMLPFMVDDPHAPGEKGAERAGREAPRFLEGDCRLLGRGIGTVQRWEREEGLPVHRLRHEKQGAAFTRVATSWRRGGRAGESPSAPSGLNPLDSTSAPRVKCDNDYVGDDQLARAVAGCAHGNVRLGCRRGRGDAQIWIRRMGKRGTRLTNTEHEYSHLSFSAGRHAYGFYAY